MAVRAPTLDDLARIDIRQLRRGDCLNGERKWIGWQADGEFLGALRIEASDEIVRIIGEADGREVSTSVRLEYVDLTFGRRPYFRCPRCDERCSLLYLHEIVCRGCVGYRYLSETLGAAARLQDRLERARLDLGLDEHGHAQRPTGMHYDTWLRKWQRYWDAQQAISRSLSSWLDELEDAPEASRR